MKNTGNCKITRYKWYSKEKSSQETHCRTYRIYKGAREQNLLFDDMIIQLGLRPDHFPISVHIVRRSFWVLCFFITIHYNKQTKNGRNLCAEAEKKSKL